MSSVATPIFASTLSSTRPFPGLRPYEEPDSDWFFGRSSEINELLKRLRRVRFVAIVGPSGCGKSSLIKAGVLPSVRDGYLDSSWSIATFRPGEQPLDNLAHAVSAAISADFEGVRKLLDTGSMGLTKAIQAKQLASGSKLLILVDQFEELFQFAQRHGDQSQEEVKAFLKLLLSAASSPDIPLYLVLTMRMEWLSECATYVGLAEAINEGIYLVPQMSRRQFQQVILNPIDKADGAITTTLLDGMLNDLGGRSDQLPVLQHALMRLWERKRPGEPIDIADYDAVGTFSSCLSNHAEEIFAGLSAQQQKVAELLFRSITQVYKNRKIRRPRPLSELVSVPGMDATELKAVIEAFGRQGRSFLFTSEGPLGPASVIDISHEALMRQWGRLSAWVEDEAEQEARLGRLQEDAAEWDRTGRTDRSLLYSGYKLQKAEEVRPRLGDSKTESDFLLASRKAERSARIFRRGALFLPLLLLVILALAFAYFKARQAQRDATNAEHQAEVEKQKATDSANAANFALQQVQRAQNEQASLTKEISAAGGSAQALAAIQNTLDAKRIYMQYVGDALPLAQLCGAKLKKSGYLVPGYEKVDPSKSPNKNQVRYFYPDEKPEADKIAGLMNQWVTGGVESKLLSNPNNVVPQGQFEVWIAAGSTGTASSGDPSSTTTSVAGVISKMISDMTTATPNVNPPPPPIIEFKTTDPTIQKGKSTKLTWRAQNATEVSIDPGLGKVSASGEQTVSPTETTTYTLTASGLGGKKEERLTLIVTQPPQLIPK
jgi:energy-coupling factor transporter ATP-binding protein EcfA2